MSQIPVENKTANTIYVGSDAVLPGETRHFEERLVPAHLRPPQPAEPAAPPPDAVAELLTKGVREIFAVLPNLSAEELKKAEEQEAAGKNRKTVLEAIAEEKLARAAGDPEMDAYVATLPGMSDEELYAQIEVMKDNPSAAAAVQNEIDARTTNRQGGDASGTQG